MSWFEFFKKQQKAPEQRRIREPLGSSGVQIYGGYLQEEYKGILINAEDRYRVYDEMERADGTISMCLKAVEDTLLSSKWGYAPKQGQMEDNPEVQSQIEFMEKVFPSNLITEFMNNAVSVAKHGYVLFDRWFRPMEIDGGVYLCPRYKYLSPRTIIQWITDEKGEFLGVYQQSSSDDPRTGFISSERLVHTALRQRGNNFEGISLIRPCYGPYARKNANYDNLAVGNRYLSIPFLKIYDESMGELDKASEEQFAERLSQRYRNEKVLMHIFFPKGIKAEEAKTNFDPMALYASNEKEDVQIIRAFCANFLMLGSQGSSGGGSFALSESLGNFFINGIENLAKKIDAVLDKELVEKAMAINFANKEVLIEINHSEINRRGGERFAKAVADLLSSRAITRDETLEAHLRDKYELPKADIETREEEPEMAQAFNQGPIQEDQEEEELEEDEIGPEETVRNSTVLMGRKDFVQQANRSFKRISMLTEEVKGFYSIGLKSILAKKVQKIMAFYRKNKDSQKLFSLKKEDFKTSSASLQTSLRTLSERFFSAERDDLDGHFSIEMAQRPSTAAMKKIVGAIVVNDILGFVSRLDTALLLTFYDIAESAEGEVAVTGFISKSGQKVIDHDLPKKSSVVPAKIIASARESVFRKREGQIESYTFYNPSPKADICVYMAGKTVSLEQKRNLPLPAHYNCKSVWIANLRTFKNNPPIETMAPTATQKKSIDFGPMGK